MKYTDKVFNYGPERSAQRNFGIKQAQGEYILYLDADMIWIIINYSLATHNLKIVIPLCVLAVLESFLICQYHTGLKTVLIILCFFAAACFSVTLGAVSLRDKKALIAGSAEKIKEFDRT